MSKGKALIEQLQGQLGNIDQQKLQLEGEKLQLQRQINQAKQNNTNNQTNANTKATFPTWYYYAAGVVVVLVIYLLV